MTEEDVPNTTFLKWVVGILGIMIVGVAVAIGLILYNRATAPDVEPVSETSAPAEKLFSKTSEFGDVIVPLPEGMSVVSTNEQGNLIYLTYGTDEADLRGIIVLNASDGALVGRFVFEN